MHRPARGGLQSGGGGGAAGGGVKVALPEDAAKRASPEYVPVTGWVAAGGLFDVHSP